MYTSAYSGGGGGIRTHETWDGLPVLETGAFDHSATPPSADSGPLHYLLRGLGSGPCCVSSPPPALGIVVEGSVLFWPYTTPIRFWGSSCLPRISASIAAFAKKVLSMYRRCVILRIAYRRRNPNDQAIPVPKLPCSRLAGGACTPSEALGRHSESSCAS